MLKTLLFAAAIAFVVSTSQGIADEPNAPGDKQARSIQAEVRGTLHFQAGRGYFISVKFGDAAERDSRVWLRVSENKALVQELAGLTDKGVVAKGVLEQMPENVQSSVPPLGIYLRNGFGIEPAAAK